MKKLILASASPRRKELLECLGFEFEVKKVNFDETVPGYIPVIETAEFLAKEKNGFIMKNDNEVVLTADTVVILNERILGKPTDELDAKSMLLNLSGSVHKVVTGVCISSESNMVTFSSITDVKFAPLTKKEIEYYVNKFLPLDKAGAYGIQEWIGQMGIEEIKGSYFNVVGLPTHEVYKVLTQVFDMHTQ